MIVQFKKWLRFYTFGLLIISIVGFVYSIINYPFEEGISVLALFSSILFALICIYINSFKIQIDNMKIEVKSILSRKKVLKIEDIVKVKEKHKAWSFISDECTVKITTDLECQQEAVALILEAIGDDSGVLLSK